MEQAHQASVCSAPGVRMQRELKAHTQLTLSFLCSLQPWLPIRVDLPCSCKACRKHVIDTARDVFHGDSKSSLADCEVTHHDITPVLTDESAARARP